MTADEYAIKKQCFIEQYGNYTIPEINMNVRKKSSTNLIKILVLKFMNCMQ